MSDFVPSLDFLLQQATHLQASDLHVAVGIPPMIRVQGRLIALDSPPFTPQGMEEFLSPLLNDFQQFNEKLELDVSYALPGVARFRGNIMRQRGSLAAVFRIVPFKIPDIDQLGLPAQIKELCYLPRGLVLITGPTGSGKSTTLAAMVDLINRERHVNIVTIEDPIEFLHKHQKSIVKQREVGIDTHSFAHALRHVLRHDPDVILIGEMRDLDSISIALTAAETGHLVFSTLHTQTAPLTISRIIDVFQDQSREQVRQQLSNTLKAVVSQQLLPTQDGAGRVLATEILLDSPAVRNLIREGKEHQLYNTMQTSKSSGMHTMDQALAELYSSGKISGETALEHSVDKVELDRLMQRASFASSSYWE
ncbi:MAG: type IV pilus twitching motility protein PilT [Bacillota bacterium]